jgi:RNA polymerase sigma-70 factor (ECF subfamily)
MKQMQLDDAAAVARAKGGDEEAFRVLVERHSRSIYRLAYRMTGRAEDAEDVVQETFVRAYRQLSRFEARSNFATWLYRVGFIIVCYRDI